MELSESNGSKTPGRNLVAPRMMPTSEHIAASMAHCYVNSLVVELSLNREGLKNAQRLGLAHYCGLIPKYNVRKTPRRVRLVQFLSSISPTSDAGSDGESVRFRSESYSARTYAKGKSLRRESALRHPHTETHCPSTFNGMSSCIRSGINTRRNTVKPPLNELRLPVYEYMNTGLPVSDALMLEPRFYEPFQIASV